MTQEKQLKTLEELQREIEQKLQSDDEVSQDEILDEAIRNGLSAADEEKLMEWLSEREISDEEDVEEDILDDEEDGLEEDGEEEEESLSERDPYIEENKSILLESEITYEKK